MAYVVVGTRPIQRRAGIAWERAGLLRYREVYPVNLNQIKLRDRRRHARSFLSFNITPLLILAKHKDIIIKELIAAVLLVFNFNISRHLI
jgi:hypothetical protein